MSVKLKDFKTDFTEFLHSNIPHTVKVVTDNKILECSSLLLSQHSSTLKDMISKDNEIFMVDYQCVEDLLVLLYGGSAELSLENCSEFIKFSCQFGISGVVEQVFNFLSSVVDKSNLVSVVRVCIGAIKAAKFFEFKPYDSEFFFAGEKVIKEMNRDEIQTFVDNFQAEDVFTMFANRVFVKQILPASASFVTQSNVESVLHHLLTLEDFIDSATLCSIEKLTEFFYAFEKLSLTAKSCKDLLQLKKSVFKQLSIDEVMTDITKPSTDSSLFTKSLKCWRNYTVDTMLVVCKYGSNGFYLFEIVLSWIELKRPTHGTVERLLSYIDLTKLPSKYLKYVEESINKLGYCMDLKSYEGTFASQCSDYPIDRVEIKYENDGPTVTVSVKKNRSRGSHPQHKITVGLTIGTNISCDYCSKCTCLAEYYVYGTGSEGRRIPFYSDPTAALKMFGFDKPNLALLKLV